MSSLKQCTEEEHTTANSREVHETAIQTHSNPILLRSLPLTAVTNTGKNLGEKKIQYFFVKNMLRHGSWTNAEVSACRRSYRVSRQVPNISSCVNVTECMPCRSVMLITWHLTRRPRRLLSKCVSLSLRMLLLMEVSTMTPATTVFSIRFPVYNRLLVYPT